MRLALRFICSIVALAGLAGCAHEYQAMTPSYADYGMNATDLALLRRCSSDTPFYPAGGSPTEKVRFHGQTPRGYVIGCAKLEAGTVELDVPAGWTKTAVRPEAPGVYRVSFEQWTRTGGRAPFERRYDFGAIAREHGVTLIEPLNVTCSCVAPKPQTYAPWVSPDRKDGWGSTKKPDDPSKP